MTTTELSPADTADWLLTPEAVRAQCGALFDRAVAGESAHFMLQPDRLNACAAEVVATTRAAYPDLRVPPHAHWRHFVLGGRDRWSELVEALGLDPLERARTETKLAIVSALLDAVAGAAWGYDNPEDGTRYVRSEGLALASLDLFTAGAVGEGRMQATAEGLGHITAADLARAFQVDPDNPLEGLEGRAQLLANLGKTIAAQPEIFGRPARLGHLADRFLGAGRENLPVRKILCTLLDRLAERVRAMLGKSATELPLAAILEGGTWATGRRLAAARRDGGVPPLSILSTGTVF
ncbi:MAG: DUF1688 family protein [Pseudomonadota bacterium]